jgi:CRISPR/Cas system-associated endonuclease Cas3-HD
MAKPIFIVYWPRCMADLQGRMNLLKEITELTNNEYHVLVYGTDESKPTFECFNSSNKLEDAYTYLEAVYKLKDKYAKSVIDTYPHSD